MEYIRQRHHDSLEQGAPITPSVIYIAEKIKKAAETSMLSGALLKHRLQDIATAEAACKKRKEGSSKVVQKYSEIRVHQARMQIQEAEEEEKEVVNIRLKKKQKV